MAAGVVTFVVLGHLGKHQVFELLDSYAEPPVVHRKLARRTRTLLCPRSLPRRFASCKRSSLDLFLPRMLISLARVQDAC